MKVNFKSFLLFSLSVPECEVDDQCADVKYCELKTHTCQDVCITAQCGINAFCNASDHKAHCECIAGYSGDAYVECRKYSVHLLHS